MLLFVVGFSVQYPKRAIHLLEEDEPGHGVSKGHTGQRK